MIDIQTLTAIIAALPTTIPTQFSVLWLNNRAVSFTIDDGSRLGIYGQSLYGKDYYGISGISAGIYDQSVYGKGSYG